MPKKHPLPQISRIKFFILKEADLFRALARAIEDEVRKNPNAHTTNHQLALHAFSRILIDVPNGGFTQFFYNHKGDHGLNHLAKLLSSFKLPKFAPLLKQASVLYRKNKKRFDVQNPFDGLFGSIPEFEKIDHAFMNAGLAKASAAGDKWIRQHIAELAVGDDGKPLDPDYTGTVQRFHPNGTLAEQLDVKKGKANGQHKEFFDDGSPRQTTFYKSGKKTEDFWPTGQLRKKESKQGPNKIIEWFFPSGTVQKRMVKGKGGYNVEPIRLFYENGRLAEELVMKKDSIQPHSLRRYFDDGSPRLIATFDDHTPVPQDAWDDSHRQIVKNGSGTFDDDGHDIDTEYKLISTSLWRRVSELKNGLRHGKTTTYFKGVLWGVDDYKNGEKDGESIAYWDNGRTREIAHFKNGKELDSQKLPKFGNPVPAVRLTIIADEHHYAAWSHVPVDTYPAALNADEIQRQFKIPPFLQKIYEQSLAGEPKSNYENWNTYNDGITYFLQIDPAGNVTSVKPSGGGMQSVGEWNTYPPLLKQLRFSPGSIRGRHIECKVIASVDHIFMEGPKKK